MMADILDLRTAETGPLRRALVETLATASPRHRQVLALSALGGLGPPAIARALGMSLEAVTIVLQDGMNEVVTRLVG
jgi:DNA-directed RNA polymerase specialized sigma24 family protein